jgi:Antibiotic biosynthesis monooxygenase
MKPEAREELLEAVRVLSDELAKEPTFHEAWVHTSEEEPDLIVIYSHCIGNKVACRMDKLGWPEFSP